MARYTRRSNSSRRSAPRSTSTRYKRSAGAARRRPARSPSTRGATTVRIVVQQSPAGNGGGALYLSDAGKMMGPKGSDRSRF